jgi:hypothetical protein
MLYPFLEPLKTTEVVIPTGPPQLPHYASSVAIWLFMRRPETLDDFEQQDVAAFSCISADTELDRGAKCRYDRAK